MNKSILKDLKLNQCFTFPKFTTVYYVTAQYPSLGRTKVAQVNNPQIRSLYESDKNVQRVTSELLGL